MSRSGCGHIVKLADIVITTKELSDRGCFVEPVAAFKVSSCERSRVRAEPTTLG